MPLPLISVVIPVFNLEREIEATLVSVLVQRELPDEVIIVDDGSTDTTMERVQAVATRCPPGLLRTVTIAHAGPAEARNRGVAEARGEWVSFLDGDDLWLPDKIESVRRTINNNPDVSLIAHDMEVRDADGRSVRLLQYAAYEADRPLQPQLYRSNFLSTSSLSVRRDSIIAAGGFDGSFTPNEDYDLWLRIAARNPRLIVIPEVLAVYVRRPDGISFRSWARYRASIRIAHVHTCSLAGYVGRGRARLMRFRRVLRVHYLILREWKSAQSRTDLLRVALSLPLQMVLAIAVPLHRPDGT